MQKSETNQFEELINLNTQNCRIENKYNFKIKDFDLSLREYYKARDIRRKSDFVPGEAERTFNQLCKKLIEILNVSGNECEVGEPAELFCNSYEGVIPKASFETAETKMGITIGLFRDFYIQTKINNANHLSLMRDEFWCLLARLQDIGKFEFKEEHKPDSALRKKYPDLFGKRGGIYKIMRNYFLNQIEYGHCSSIGFISVKWDSEIGCDAILSKYIDSFKIMYKLNYMLWLEDLKIKKKTLAK